MASTRRRVAAGRCGAQFLCFQAEAIIACDFFAVDLLDGSKAYVMAVIEHAGRRVHWASPWRRTRSWLQAAEFRAFRDLIRK